MTTSPLLYDVVAEATVLPVEVQAAFAALPDYQLALARNQALDLSVWDLLWKLPKKSAELATSLVARSLTSDRMSRVLAKERRSGVLSVLVANNPPRTIDELQNFLPVLSSESVALALYRAVKGCEELRDRVGPLLGGLERLAWMAETSQVLNAASVASHLADMESWFGSSRAFHRRSQLLKTLFERHPEVLEACLTHSPRLDSSVRLAAAGSRQLISEELQARVLGHNLADIDKSSQPLGGRFTELALAANPRTTQRILDLLEHGSPDLDVVAAVQRRRGLGPSLGHPTVSTSYRDVDDASVLDWLIRRACAYTDRYSGKYRPPRAFDLLDLAHNQNLSVDQANAVATNLATQDNLDVVGESEMTSALAALRAQYPSLDEDLVSTEWMGKEERSHSGPTRPLLFTPTDESREHVLTVPAGQVLQQQHLTLAISEVMVEKLGSDVYAWQLFAEMAQAATTTPLGDALVACRRLANAKRV